MINSKIFLLLNVFFFLGINLTGDQIAAYCYCDITQNFCDFDCCCDASCSSDTDNSCLNVNSRFCIQREFYYKISQQVTQNTDNQDCYDYAQDSSIQEQVTPSSKQIISQIKKAKKLVPVPNAFTGMYQGYKSNIEFTVQDISNFEFVQNDGNCLSSSSSMTNLHFKLKFKNDVKIRCLSSSNSIKLFSSFLGKKVYRYYLNTNSSSTITIPSSMDSQNNELHIYFILGTYGSQKLFYIRDVQTRTLTNSNSNIRTLVIKYINPYVDYDQEKSAPSIFPQIPYDIFYPIQQYVYSF